MNTVGVILLAFLTITSVQCDMDDLIDTSKECTFLENCCKVDSKDSTTPSPATGVQNATGCLEGFVCVPYYLCRGGTVLKDGDGLIDIRSGRTSSKIPNCGFRNLDGVGFKIPGDNDNETHFGEFPWMVAVLKVEKDGDQTLNIYQCGGSLIHPGVVLTAAHCVSGESENSLRVRAGEWDTQTKDELLPHQDRGVNEIIIHEHYKNRSLHNDIALLFLSSPVELADNVKTVCLPPRKTNFDYTRCIATGWGNNDFKLAGKYQVIMKKIDLPIVPYDACQASLRTTRLSKYFELDRSFICAGGEKGKDTCTGDGGSPLVCPIGGKPEQYYQAGIVAWGIGCGEAIPGVYASVSELREWLDGQLAYKKIDSRFYTP